jgi:hypothetical protein
VWLLSTLRSVSTYDKLLQVILERRAGEEKTPSRFILQESIISLRLEILEDMAFIKDTRL